MGMMSTQSYTADELCEWRRDVLNFCQQLGTELGLSPIYELEPTMDPNNTKECSIAATFIKAGAARCEVCFAALAIEGDSHSERVAKTIPKSWRWFQYALDEGYYPDLWEMPGSGDI